MLSRYRDRLALLVSLGLLVALFGWLSPGFLSTATLGGIAQRVPTLSLVATGMTLVLIVGGIDLSVGSVLALSGSVIGVLLIDWKLPLGVAGLAGILSGLTIGALNGMISESLRVPSFIVTLGTLEASRGLAYLVTNSQTKYLSGKLELLVRPIGSPMITAAMLLTVAVVILAQLVLSRAVIGRQMIAIGTNEQATRLAGIATRPVKVIVFATSGALAGLAAVCQLARLGASDPNAGSGLELSAIAAAVIGGTSLNGGRGSVLATFLGVLIIATLEAGLAQIGASEPVKRVVTGAVIVAAVVSDTWRRKER